MKRNLIKALTIVAIVAITSTTFLNPITINADTSFTEEYLLYKGEDTGIRIVTNEDGVEIGYSKDSGVTILVEDGKAFKDLDKDGELDVYEDWRLTVDERAKDLATKMSVEEIAGLMLYSAHQSIPAGGWTGGTYDGNPYEEGVTDPTRLSDQQKSFIENDNLRHVLITTVKSPEVAARWNNNGQSFAESLGLGIPLNNSSDPRHSTDSSAEYNAGSGGIISMWPSSIGMAATFDPSLVEEFGQVASKEYRALGIATALSPQIDLATDPRWSRVSGTFGESTLLSTDMARAYVDGFQTTEEASGWGQESVNAMVKHWPGGGTGEAGRDAHYGFGKYAVYPGNNFGEHMLPFTEGAFNLNGGTSEASAVMPYYTISYNQDPTGGNVGNSYSKYIITDLLREKYGYDGVVCTDWGITKDDLGMDVFGATPWGVEDLTTAEKFYLLLQTGIDQFGGVNTSEGILAGYELGVKDKGEGAMRTRMEQSAVRLLRNIFQTGLFENPYLDVEESVETVGNAEFMEAGYEAQLKSVVMLKNKENVLPLNGNGDEKLTVYIPQKYIPETTDRFGNVTPASWVDAVNMNIAQKYFNIATNPSEADAALVFVDDPDPGLGYSAVDKSNGGNGFLPLTLQYGEYKAEYAREISIAGDSRPTDVLNRTYKDKVVTANNTKSLDIILETKKSMGDKPVITCINMSNPMVFSEFESEVDGIVLGFGIQDQAFLEILSGVVEPSGLLPLQMPASMKVVEEQSEDLAFDMECHVDSEGNVYDFAFGLNWSGVINDDRVEMYANKTETDEYKANKEAAEKVANLIAALPEYITLNDELAIIEARTAYNELTDVQKALVKNYDFLVKAEKDLANLKEITATEKADQEAAQKVINAIKEIPTNITLNDEEKIKEVRIAYDALTEKQKLLVTNYNDLVSAEKKLADLKKQNSGTINNNKGDSTTSGKLPYTGAVVSSGAMALLGAITVGIGSVISKKKRK
jgi:beta-glucosidase